MSSLRLLSLAATVHREQFRPQAGLMLSCANLCDQDPPGLQVAEPVFRDYGGRLAFEGPVRTVSVHEGNSFGRRALEQPGQGAASIAGRQGASSEGRSWAAMRTVVLLLFLAALALAEPTPQFPQPVREGESFLEWSATGRRILASDDKHLWVHDLESMKTQTFSVRTTFYAAELDPQEQLLAITSYPCALQVYDWRRGQRLWEFQGPSGPQEGSYQPAFSPDGRYLMISSASHGRNKLDPWVRVFEARSGKLVRKWNWLTSHAVGVGWTSDGAVVKADGKFLASFDLATGAKKASRAEELISLGSPVKGQPTVTYGDPLKKSHFASIQSSSLELVELDSPSYEPARTSPDGQLLLTTEMPIQVKRQDGTVVWSGQNVFNNWTDDGFAVDNEGKTEFYRSDGTLLGTVNAEHLILGKTRLAYTGFGYGGPVGLYDVKSYTTLLELPYASMPKYSPDESKLAFLTRKGVLILDVAATLQALPQLVWWSGRRNAPAEP